MNNLRELEKRYATAFKRRTEWRGDGRELGVSVVHRIGLVLDKLKKNFFHRFGIQTAEEFQILLSAWDYRDIGGFPQSDLSETLMVDGGTVSHRVRSLKERKFVENAKISSSKRKLAKKSSRKPKVAKSARREGKAWVTLTSLGGDVFDRADRVYMKHLGKLFDGFSEEEIGEFIRLLARFEDGILKLINDEEFRNDLHEQEVRSREQGLV